jgi:hypothetical protein
MDRMEIETINERSPLMYSKSQTNIDSEEDNDNFEEQERPGKLTKAISMQELSPPYRTTVYINGPQGEQ